MTGRWYSAREVVGRLGGRWLGSNGTCQCPAHDDKTPSLSVGQTRNGRLLVHCFSGCAQLDVIDALRALGLWPDGAAVMDPSYPGRFTTPRDRDINTRDEIKMRQGAQDLWDAARPASGTAVEDYLRGRGIRIPISSALRFAPRLKHSPSGNHYRTMVGCISDGKNLCAIQRTFLDPDKPTKAPVQPNKMCKGPMGDGAVRLREPGEVLGIAEGIESALSAMQIYSIPTWAALSAVRLGKIEIPQHVRSLVIFADAGNVGIKAAFDAADTYEARRYAVEVITPNADYAALGADDFNTVLRMAG